jgi:hypothetical protein
VGIPESWKNICEPAASLFDALASAWACQCKVAHCVSLLIDDSGWRERNNNGDFKLWFSLGMDTNSSLDMGTYNTSPGWAHIEVNTLRPQPMNLRLSEPQVNAGGKYVSVPETQHNNKPWTNIKKLLKPKKYATRKDVANFSFRKTATAEIPKKVEFVTEREVEPPETCFNVDLSKIPDLCTALKDSHRTVCSVRFLNCSHGYRHELYSVPDSRTPSLSVPELLSRDNHKLNRQPLSRKDRKELSVHISNSLLQLYQTPWISDEWKGSEIMFNGQTYLRRRFLCGTRTGLTSTAVPTKDTRAIVFRLGVLLLELCVGDTLMYQDGGRQSNEMESEIAYRCWAQKAKAEEGDEVAEAIRKCLKFDFLTESRSLQNEDLRLALYNEVVRPLNEALDNFRVA